MSQPIRPHSVTFEHLLPREQPLDATHPDWHERAAYTVNDTDVLLEGLRQAQVVTRTVCVDGLPSELSQLVAGSQAANIPEQTDRAVRNATLTAHCFDAEQVKLARRKDPKRPAYVLPRDYGISDARRS